MSENQFQNTFYIYVKRSFLLTIITHTLTSKQAFPDLTPWLAFTPAHIYTKPPSVRGVTEKPSPDSCNCRSHMSRVYKKRNVDSGALVTILAFGAGDPRFNSLFGQHFVRTFT